MGKTRAGSLPRLHTTPYYTEFASAYRGNPGSALNRTTIPAAGL